MPTPSIEAFEYTDPSLVKARRRFALVGSLLSIAFFGVMFYALVCV